MSERNEFDDLARRKLEERETAFHEADWSAAERMIAAQHTSSGSWKRWVIGAAALLFVGATAWWSMSATETVERNSSVAENTPKLATTPIPGTEGGTTAANNEVESNSSPAPTGTTEPDPIARTRNTSTERLSANENNTPEQASNLIKSVKVTPKKNQSTTPRIAKSTRSLAPVIVAEASGTKGTGTFANGPKTHVAQVDSKTIPSTTDDGNEAATTALNTIGTAPLEDKSVSIADIDQSTSEGIRNDDVAIAVTTPPAGTQKEADVSVHIEETNYETNAPSNVVVPSIPNGIVQGTSPADPTTDGSTRSTVREEANMEAQNATDSLVMIADRPQDSAAIAQPSVPPLELIKPASPWEIGILFGGLRSTSTYTGGNSGDWNGGLKGRWSPAFGAEVMHMGRNFGIGSGIQYTTYEEDLSVDAQSLTTTVIRDSNYFEPFNTTILYVIGNVTIDGQDWYVTESRDTTINILVLGTHTFSSTRQLIDALRVVNRVSYVEIPLLLDAHLTQGAWMLGLRGGPTIGVLTGRRGTIPNAEFDGYSPFTTEQFRRTQLGLTARAYIRYKFTNGWAVGIEPTWRTQLGNAFSSGDLVRANSGIGGMLSVTYRLR